MNNKLRFFTNSIFVVYLISGLAYLVLLFLLSTKVLPGFLMQLLFLIDEALRGFQSGISLLTNRDFVQTIFFGFLTLTLLSVVFRGILTSLRQYFFSARLIKNLKPVATSKHIITFKSAVYGVFTAGLLHPQVYLSDSLKSFLSKKQLQAVLLHEFSHRRDHDPLRGYLVALINNILPRFPLKQRLWSLYQTTVELKSDARAASVLGEKRPIIEALYAIIMHNNQRCAKQFAGAYFSDMPERIPILVGDRKFNYQGAMILASAFMILFLSLPAFTLTQKFYDCEHLVNCVQILVNNLKAHSSEDLGTMHPVETFQSSISN